MGNAFKTLTKEQMIQVEKLASALTIEQIADFLGICRTTFFELRKRDKDINAHYKKGKSRAIGSVAQGLLQKAQSGDTSAQIFYLKTQAGWREKQDINHSSDDGTMSPVKIEFVNKK